MVSIVIFSAGLKKKKKKKKKVDKNRTIKENTVVESIIFNKYK